ncbi:MAG: DUF465 domain-containing protein [Candidatus Pacebacteria bacterium]|jgi:uncharacterized protein YdcH (DUF465 family)|nr:DUF465 domain-containing protein [Candidatus Paceibacterota bacterium]
MTNTTSVILTDVSNHYNQLVDEHQKLHKEIEHYQYKYTPDADLKKLKIKKLRLKDEILRLKSNLENIIK